MKISKTSFNVKCKTAKSIIKAVLMALEGEISKIAV